MDERKRDYGYYDSKHKPLSHDQPAWATQHVTATNPLLVNMHDEIPAPSRLVTNTCNS
jgi:hypothetical protein